MEYVNSGIAKKKSCLFVIGKTICVFPHPLLLDVDSNAAEISTSLLLLSIHIFHSRSISDKMQSLLLSLSPCFPDGRTLESVSVGVVASDETGPVCLGHRHNVGIDSAVGSRSIALSVVRTPDGGNLNSVSDSAAGGCSNGVNDIPVVVVDVLAVGGCSVDVRDVDAGAVVAQFSVLITSLSPPSARVGKLVACIVGVQLVDLLDLAER